MKKLLLLSILLSGCAQYCGVEQPTSPTPIYPPMYDVQPLKQLLRQTQNEALRLEQFAKNDNNLLRLRWALEAYKYAAQDLYYAVETSPQATITYQPWQTR